MFCCLAKTPKLKIKSELESFHFRCLSKALKSEFWIVNWFYVMETHFALGWRELFLKCFAFLFEFCKLYSLNSVLIWKKLHNGFWLFCSKQGRVVVSFPWFIFWNQNNYFFWADNFQSQFRTWDLESFKLYWYSTTKVNPDVGSGTALLRIPR